MTRRFAEPSAAETALADRATVVHPAASKVVMKLPLSSEEGFVFSRLDRPMSVGELLRNSGMPESTVFPVLLSLVTKGAVLLPADAAKASGRGTKEKGPYDDFVFSPGELNEEVDIDLETKKLILFTFHRMTEISYYRLLDVTPRSPLSDVKRGYQEKSKVFHPDRFFRKNLGAFLPRVQTLFQQLKLAYDTLMDEEARTKYDRENTRLFTQEEKTQLIERELEKLEDEQRQKARRERMLHSRGLVRLTKAREVMKDGDEALARGDVSAAVNAYQLAFELDPRLEEARTKQVEARKVAQSRRADLVITEGLRMLDGGDTEKATTLLRNAVDLDANNSRAHLELAALLLVHGDPKEARVHAQRAVDLGERSARARVVLGEALLKSGMKKNARREFELAIEAGDKDRAPALLKKC